MGNFKRSRGRNPIYLGIIDAQKFGRARYGVDVEMLALGPLFIHEAENGVIRVGLLEDNTDDADLTKGR